MQKDAMNCWSCGVALPEPSWGKISFRATCDRCGAALHCCRNCKYFKQGMPNDCLVPGTEWVADRMAPNFCEEFALLGKAPPSQEDNRKRFEDLFK